MSTEINLNELYNNSIKILSDLISFKTISGEDNSALINYCEEYLHKLFLNPLVDEKEIAQIISSAGKEFYLAAYDVISLGISDWNECVKKIGNQSGKKGRELFMPLRVAITGQTKGPELDKVAELIGSERILKRIKEASEL